MRFDAEQPTESMAIAVTTWCDLVTDLAVLTIDPPDSQSLVPARFGYADDVGAFIEGHIAGFPFWKRRQQRGPNGMYTLRDLHHGIAKVAAASGRRTGRFEVEVSPPRDTSDAEQSPWAGMSGGPLWANDAIIGVIAEHHRHEGPNWLTAVCIDRCLARVSGLGRS